MQNYQYGQALDCINGLSVESQSHSFTVVKAKALKGLNRFGEAIPFFEQLLKEDNKNLSVIISLADCYMSVADCADARLYYHQALTLNPENGYLFQQMADAYYMDEDFSAAVHWYKKALQSDSSYYLSKQLARSYEKLDVQDTAIFFYQRAVELNPRDFHSSYRLSDLLRQANDLESAIDVAESYLQIDSVKLKMVKYNAYLHYLQKDYPGALEGFRKCLVLGDESEFTHKFLGYSYFRTGEYDVAMIHLEKAFRTDTANVNLCYVLGLSSDYSEHEKKAITYLRKTLDLTIPPPDFLSQVYQDLAAACTDNGD
ncbi:MAG TPA: tetratricopeptide repeat protein, partial [Bacteroidales bacterium]|nr:tetratricopeptide repeat protein [Bacteroidales bacterium]